MQLSLMDLKEKKNFMVFLLGHSWIKFVIL